MERLHQRHPIPEHLLTVKEYDLPSSDLINDRTVIFCKVHKDSVCCGHAVCTFHMYGLLDTASHWVHLRACFGFLSRYMIMLCWIMRHCIG